MADNEKYYDPSQHEPMPEGEEKAPPLTHTMSIVRWAILGGMTLFAIIMIFSALGLAPWEAQANDNVQYNCPMHPTYISNQPGECPICGMSLVPIDSKGKEVSQSDTGKKAESKDVKQSEKSDDKAASAVFVCPMHLDVKSDKPGECPKCGMDLVKASGLEKLNEAVYSCPMHPEVTSNKPGECPKCGMDLVKLSKEVPQKLTYACPMHPDITSDKPAECSKCGMDLVMVSDTTKVKLHEGHDGDAKPMSSGAKYFCPMHPEVTSSEPGRCPKCKMFLEPIKQESNDTTKVTPSSSHEGHSGLQMENNEQASVPGLVPVTIEPQRLQLIGVTTAAVERRKLDSEIESVGFITPDEGKTENVNARVSGWVTDLFVDNTGQFVEAGAPLLTLYSQDLYQAEQDFMVARDALKNGSDDEALITMRQKIFAAARERLGLLGLSRDQIDDIETHDLPSPQLMLKSPVSGYVLSKNVLPGQYISPDQNLLTIADLSEVWLISDVYEKDISYIREGQSATMTLAARPGERFEGKIDYIYPSISEQTRTLKIRVRVPNQSLSLKPGMYAEVGIGRTGKERLAIPNEAILDNGDIQYAFVVHDGNHFEPRKLRLGRTTDDWTEIISGLENGERVLTSSNFLIDSESRLKAAIAGMAGNNTQPAETGTHAH